MGNIFQNVRFKSSKRYKYDLSHEVKASMKIGNLYPILRMDVLPGDKFNVNTQHVLKLQPMLAPIMHTIDVKVDYFYIPNRIISKGFNEFVLGIDPLASPPYITTNHCIDLAEYQYNNIGQTWMFEKMLPGTLWDFLGYPTPINTQFPTEVNSDTIAQYADLLRAEIGNDVKLSALPFLAFRSVWSNYYRWYNQPEDSLFEEEIAEDKDISEAIMAYFSKYEPAKWERDYFTSALSSPQAGKAQDVSLGGEAPLVFDGYTSDEVDDNATRVFKRMYDPITGQYKEVKRIGNLETNYAGSSTPYGVVVKDVDNDDYDGSEAGNMMVDVTGYTHADVSKATSVDVEVLREAFILQRIKEMMQAGGNKPIDRLKSLWGVNSSDARLQIPEYLGGGRSPLVISSVLQQSQDTNGGYALGKQGGEGLSVGKASAFNRYFEEHGIVLGIMRIVPRTAYYQGVHRDLLRVAQGDFAMPQLAVLGEQAIKNCELYFKSLDPEGTFGYQSRYADYKYIPDKVHGEFKTTLNYWHMGRRFDTSPQLSKEFQEVDYESVQSSVFSNPQEDTIYCDIYHNIKAKRKLKPNYL